MAIELQRPVKVYRLWRDSDLFECMADQAAQGWEVTLTTMDGGEGVQTAVTFNHRGMHKIVKAERAQVVICDYQSVEPMSKRDFKRENAAIDLDDDTGQAGS